MPLPGALAPLRHPVFRNLWIAGLAANTGLWVQNTGAAWLMTSLAPSPVMVSLVQASSMLPVFLLALPAGAIADILDRRRTLIAAQLWMACMGLLVALLTFSGGLGAWGLLAITFGIGAGTAAIFPAMAATTPELVPREDLVQAIALNGIGFNLARATGPAVGGFTIALAGVEASFVLATIGFFVMVGALLLWRREVPARSLPPEHLWPAMRSGIFFVVASPGLRAAILRACAFFFFTAAVWGLLPLLVRVRLGLGPDAFGLMLTAMGAGAVTGGFLLPTLAGQATRGTLVFRFSLLAAASLLLLGAWPHWLPAGLGMVGFGFAWIGASSALQAAAQLASPAWVRARAIGIYQLSFFGALALGSALWGMLGEWIGIAYALVLAAILGTATAVLVRPWRLEPPRASEAPASALPLPDAPAAELAELLGEDSGRVLEVVHYTVAAADRVRFLAVMGEMRRMRIRSGARVWRLYEDIAHPERFAELWTVENWTEHLREAGRLDAADRATLARAAAFHKGDGAPEATRYLNLQP
ncbi:MFS transporter [Plastoroseomonas hellenica]|uniref:MFS transporter n=1 Tax=Plastoroseomonas hellenica TaxID=2687306 RepID=UPI001BA9568A|nr:MFS transporter [Plastoroseomonas hellenica]MBR0645815.1 MFS transporter [Plastoroseomonas hellenica]